MDFSDHAFFFIICTMGILELTKVDLLRASSNQVLVAHTFNHSTQEAEVDGSECEASLVYSASSRTVKVF